MSTQIQLRRGTTVDNSTFTGASGELIADTTKNILVLHDGITAGGHPFDLAAHLADYTLQVPYAGTTTNVDNAYSISTPAIDTLEAGMAICVKINADSTGASTLNWNSKGAKSIKKANGSDVTNLKANGIYTLRYDGTNFILQGEGASGNATASDLLSGKTATTDAGEITGTLALSGDALAANVLSGKTFYNTDPKTKVTGSMPNRTGGSTHVLTDAINGTAAPQRLYFRAPEGYYDGAFSVYGEDANFIAGNIKSGVNIFGLAGTSNPQGSQTFITSGSFVAPTGVYFVDVFLVGGGGGGYRAMGGGGGGGGSGQAFAIAGIPVVPGTSYAITIGAGGAQADGGATIVYISPYYTAQGGKAPTSSSTTLGGRGGSGGGRGTQSSAAYAGESDGGEGVWTGLGQKNTTKLFGFGALYAGGGGGGAVSHNTPGAGGSGGGGSGGSNTVAATAGTPNSGGGGGGGGTLGTNGGVGGSGVVIIKWGY